MQYFTRLSRLLLAGVGLTLALPAFAAGTDAGLLVTNSVTLDYQVNGGDQPQQTDSIDFTVDLRLDVLVGAVDADWISATIGQEVTGVPPLTGVPALNFLVTNNSNADVDVVLGVVERGAVDITGFTNDPGATSTGVDGVTVRLTTGATQLQEILCRSRDLSSGHDKRVSCQRRPGPNRWSLTHRWMRLACPSVG